MQFSLIWLSCVKIKNLFVKRDMDCGTPRDVRGGRVLRPHSLPARSCAAKEGDHFGLLGEFGLGTLGLGTPHSLLGISVGGDRGGSDQVLVSLEVRDLGSFLRRLVSHLWGRI